MTASDFLARLVGALDRADIAYMLSGSMASALHGEPRATQDLDLVVEMDAAALERLVPSFPEEHYYLSVDAARDAVQHRRQFNVIDFETGWKADLILRKGRPFSLEEFSRRQRATVLGVDLWVASAEDVILAKLEWARLGGGSERQLRDVRGVLELQRERLDMVYLHRWALELGVEELLHDVASP